MDLLHLKEGGKAAVRSAIESDLHFIYNSWLNSYRPSKANVGMTKTVYFAHQSKVINKILSKPTTKILVVCSPEDNQHIYGYIVFDDNTKLQQVIVHYVYVKQAYRRLNMATALLASITADWLFPIISSHWPAEQDLSTFIKEQKIQYDPSQR